MLIALKPYPPNRQGFHIEHICIGTDYAIYKWHGRSSIHNWHGDFFRAVSRIHTGLRIAMSSWELILSSVVAVLLTVYLLYSLLRPEKF